MMHVLGGAGFEGTGDDRFEGWKSRTEKLAGDLAGRTVAGLRSWARGFGLKRSGTKGELIARLKANRSEDSEASQRCLSDASGCVSQSRDGSGGTAQTTHSAATVQTLWRAIDFRKKGR